MKIAQGKLAFITGTAAVLGGKIMGNLHSLGRSSVVMAVAIVLSVVGTVAQAAGNSGKRNIEKVIHPNAARVHVVAADSGWANPDACDRSDQLVLKKRDLSDERVYREMLAMILSAHLSDRQIAAKVRGCAAVNGLTYPLIVQLTLY